MTPLEFKAIRANLKLSQHELGVALLLNSQRPADTISLWERGLNPIPGPVIVAMRFFERYGVEKVDG